MERQYLPSTIHCRSSATYSASHRVLQDKDERGAREEERRAQKALLLLKARDQQILLLENRVAQLENAAADMHAIASHVQTNTPQTSGDTSYLSIAQGSSTSLDSQENSDNVVRGQNSEANLNQLISDKLELTESKTGGRHPVLVPELKLSMLPPSDSDNELFSTPVLSKPRENDVGTDDKGSQNLVACSVSEDTLHVLVNEPSKSIDAFSKYILAATPLEGKIGDDIRHVKPTGTMQPENAFPQTCNINVDQKIFPEMSERVPQNSNCSLQTLLIAAAARSQSKETVFLKQCESNVKLDNTVTEQSGRGMDGSTASFAKSKSSCSTKLSPSVPWVRMKRQLRRKSRGHERGFCTKTEVVSRAADIRRQRIGIDSTSKSLSAVDGTFLELANRNGKGTGVIFQDEEAKLGSTSYSDHHAALSKIHVTTNSAPVEINKHQQPGCLSDTNVFVGTLEGRKFSKHWSSNDKQTSQWLKEDVFNRGCEMNVTNRWDHMEQYCMEPAEDVSPLKKKYGEMIRNLEGKLNHLKLELEMAHKEKNNLHNQFERAIRDKKIEATRENAVQEKIVQICSSVLENFKPHAFNAKQSSGCARFKSNKSYKLYGKLTKKLHRKLRSALAVSDKLRDELEKTKEVLSEKTIQHDLLSQRFTKLKQQLEITELNLRDLNDKNSFLRKKFEDTRKWMEIKIGKDLHERNNVMQLKNMPKSRVIINLKNKTDEDVGTKTQFGSKLARSESTNTNERSSLNTYKAQVANLVKEKEQAISKNKELEIDLTQLRNANAHLKVKGLLKQLNNHEEDLEVRAEFDDDASRNEALKTACSILKMTPEELSGFMKGRPVKKINTWLAEFHKITSRGDFSGDLAEHLLEEVFGSA
nr:uncharacterized protein LOC124216468 [Neodiprion pinetum]